MANLKPGTAGSAVDRRAGTDVAMATAVLAAVVRVGAAVATVVCRLAAPAVLYAESRVSLGDAANQAGVVTQHGQDALVADGTLGLAATESETEAQTAAVVAGIGRLEDDRPAAIVLVLAV